MNDDDDDDDDDDGNDVVINNRLGACSGVFRKGGNLAQTPRR